MPGQSFNGKSVFLSDNWISSDHLKLFTDASGNIGYAAVFGGLQILGPNLYTATKEQSRSFFLLLLRWNYGGNIW